MKNGKKICETLKQIRLDIAQANGIGYIPRKCHHKGDCAGTCPACDSELMYLDREISRKRSLGKAVIVGICLGIASLSLTSCTNQSSSPSSQITGYIPADTTEISMGSALTPQFPT